jgi:hypothetical protein
MLVASWRTPFDRSSIGSLAVTQVAGRHYDIHGTTLQGHLPRRDAWVVSFLAVPRNQASKVAAAAGESARM